MQAGVGGGRSEASSCLAAQLFSVILSRTRPADWAPVWHVLEGTRSITRCGEKRVDAFRRNFILARHPRARTARTHEFGVQVGSLPPQSHCDAGVSTSVFGAVDVVVHNGQSCAGSPRFCLFVSWLFWIGGLGLLGDTTAFTLITKLAVLAISAVGLAASEASPRRRAAHQRPPPDLAPATGARDRPTRTPPPPSRVPEPPPSSLREVKGDS